MLRTTRFLQLASRDLVIKRSSIPVTRAIVPQSIFRSLSFAQVAGTSAVLIGSTTFLRKPVHCQGGYAMAGASPPLDTGRTFDPVFDGNEKKPTDADVSRTLFHKGEMSFGVVLGFCTGYFIKKFGKLYVMIIGAGFVFLQYLSFKGFITVNWDRMERGYNRKLDIDHDGKVTSKDVRTRWNGFVGFLTHGIQFKSTFLVGLYTGLRYG